MRCGNEIKKYSSGWGGCYNLACLECSKIIESLPKDSIGLTTDANIRYCYWLETGRVMPIEIAESIMGKEYSRFTEEETEYFEQALKCYMRMEGHSVMGMIGWARKKEGITYV